MIPGPSTVVENRISCSISKILQFLERKNGNLAAAFSSLPHQYSITKYLRRTFAVNFRLHQQSTMWNCAKGPDLLDIEICQRPKKNLNSLFVLMNAHIFLVSLREQSLFLTMQFVLPLLNFSRASQSANDFHD